MGKLKMIRVGRILVMALILVGCYPHPHPYYRSPDLSGTLVEKGIPVAGATVLLGAFPGDSDKRCPDAVVVGMTNEKGAFEIRPIIKTQWFQSLLNPPESVLQYTSICFREHESTVLGVAIIAASSHQTTFSLYCDLGWEHVEFVQHAKLPEDQRGICRNASTTLQEGGGLFR